MPPSKHEFYCIYINNKFLNAKNIDTREEGREGKVKRLLANSIIAHNKE